ncbi:MAG: hypothetical protein L7U60_00435 [Bacteroidia bacterium]|jgi:hypothetical protein|nr:hypothetical protein [Bacteroidia bacterium]
MLRVFSAILLLLLHSTSSGMIQTVVDVCCLEEHTKEIHADCCQTKPQKAATCCSEGETDHDDCNIKNIYIITAKYFEQTENFNFEDFYTSFLQYLTTADQLKLWPLETPNSQRPTILSYDPQSIHCVWII